MANQEFDARLNLSKFEIEVVEASFGYQAIFDPSFNPDDETIHVVSFRISQFF
jgi:hypothetical protein